MDNLKQNDTVICSEIGFSAPLLVLRTGFPIRLNVTRFWANRLVIARKAPRWDR
jgi:hypothetical protein